MEKEILNENTEKENCLNCYWIQKITGQENKYRCWEEPYVCDHAFVQTEQEANGYKCPNYVSNKKTFCRDCRFKASLNDCNHIKNAKIRNDFIILNWTDDMTESCEFFESKKNKIEENNGD